jgi:hypothetical protein
MRNFTIILIVFILTNILLFEIFEDNSFLIEKEKQFLKYFSSTNLPHLLLTVAQYIHTKSPLLEHEPYMTPETDGRWSTWYLPPGQVVVEWIFFSTLFIYIITHGVFQFSGIPHRNPRLAKLVFILCCATLSSVVYYKLRAWIELGEWFAVLYLLQPCHMLLAGHAVVAGLLLFRSYTSRAAVVVYCVLFDLQWFTYVAIALPDTRALLERNFFGEFFLFYFEHILLILLPFIETRFFFSNIHQPFLRDKIKRVLFSLACFGIHHIQIMTPVSLVSGVQINYQTHLPRYAVPWFGRGYKLAITSLSFVAMILFTFLVNPIVKRALRPSRAKSV